MGCAGTFERPIEGEQIDTLLKQHPYYQRSRIAANLYPAPSGRGIMPRHPQLEV